LSRDLRVKLWFAVITDAGILASDNVVITNVNNNYNIHQVSLFKQLKISFLSSLLTFFCYFFMTVIVESLVNRILECERIAKSERFIAV
jgi:hypothetical protein